MKINHLVCGVIARSSCSGVSRKPFSMLGLDDDGPGIGEQHDVGIADPVGRGDDDFVARVERRHHGVVDHGLAARRDEALRRRIIEAVLALELRRDGRTQFGNAFDGGVFRLAPPNGGDRCFLDVVGRVEVRFAGAERDDVAALPPSDRAPSGWPPWFAPAECDGENLPRKPSGKTRGFTGGAPLFAGSDISAASAGWQEAWVTASIGRANNGGGDNHVELKLSAKT